MLTRTPQGTIEKDGNETYKCSGTITRTKDDTIEITELPIRVWTQTYKELLEAWVAGTEKTPALVKVRLLNWSAQLDCALTLRRSQDYKEYHSDTTVHFIISLTDKGKEAIEKEGLEKAFKMTSKLNTSNMVCFDPAGKIKKYTTPEQILDDFYDIRLEHYHKRKEFLLNELTNAHDKLSNQARFIQMIISRELVISNRKRADIVAELRKKDFRPFPRSRKAHVAADPNADDDEDEVEGADSDYDYLLSMALYSLTAEKVPPTSVRVVWARDSDHSRDTGRQAVGRARRQGARGQPAPQALRRGPLGPRPRRVLRPVGGASARCLAPARADADAPC